MFIDWNARFRLNICLQVYKVWLGFLGSKFLLKIDSSEVTISLGI